MWRRVSTLPLIGAQLAVALLLRSSIVPGFRGWPDIIVVSNFIRFGKSHWPAPVCWCIHLGMSSVDSLSRIQPRGHIMSRRERLRQMIWSCAAWSLLIRDIACVWPSRTAAIPTAAFLSVSWSWAQMRWAYRSPTTGTHKQDLPRDLRCLKDW